MSGAGPDGLFVGGRVIGCVVHGSGAGACVTGGGNVTCGACVTGGGGGRLVVAGGGLIGGGNADGGNIQAGPSSFAIINAPFPYRITNGRISIYIILNIYLLLPDKNSNCLVIRICPYVHYNISLEHIDVHMPVHLNN